MGIAGSAFTAKNEVNANKHPQATIWFRFMGDQTNLLQLQDNTKYSYYDGQECPGQDVICAVLYTGIASSGQHPDAFSSSFKTRIASVYNGGSDASVSKEDE